MEGSAHAMARSLAELIFPASVCDRLRHSTLACHGESAADVVTPYMICDLLISRYLRKAGIQEFPRDVVLAVVDRALAGSNLLGSSTKVGNVYFIINRADVAFMKVLSSSTAASLSEGIVADDPSESEMYRDILTNYEAGGSWQSIPAQSTLPMSLLVWESYIAKEVVVPILRHRLETNHECFRKELAFYRLVRNFGLPPATFANGHLSLNMPERVCSAWFHQLMIGEIVRQMFSASTSILCPRAHKLIPFISAAEFALPRKCDNHIRLGCGTFRTGHAGHTPDCLFENILKECQIRRV